MSVGMFASEEYSNIKFIFSRPGVAGARTSTEIFFSSLALRGAVFDKLNRLVSDVAPTILAFLGATRPGLLHKSEM